MSYAWPGPISAACSCQSYFESLYGVGNRNPRSHRNRTFSWLACLPSLVNSESTECFYESVEIDIAGGDDLVEGSQELETFTSVNHFLMNERSLAADGDGGVLREPRRDRGSSDLTQDGG